MMAIILVTITTTKIKTRVSIHSTGYVTARDIKREKKIINKIRLIGPRAKALGIQFKEEGIDKQKLKIILP